MPRMSKKRRLEWSFFLNHRNRITYNDLCRGCTHGCKQSFRAIIVLCPRYFSKRWKHREDTTHARIYDRLLEMCAPVCFTAKNFCREAAKAKLDRLKELLK